MGEADRKKLSRGTRERPDGTRIGVPGFCGRDRRNVDCPVASNAGVFPDIAYLDWISGRPERAEYDLGSSDLARQRHGTDAPPVDTDSPGGDSGSPTADADPPAADVIPPALVDVPTPNRTARELLAEAYGVETGNVLVTAGATHANFLAVAAALPGGASNGTSPAGDRVLVEKPGYEPLLATPQGLGATVDRFRRPPGEDYPLDTDRVAGAVVEDTRLVAVTNRHNPSGRLVDRDALAAIAGAVADASANADAGAGINASGSADAGVAAGASARTAGSGDVGDADAREGDTTGARLLVDEVYAPFVDRSDSSPAGIDSGDASAAGDDASGPFGGSTAAGLENVVVTNSLTKFLGFGGVRLGWLVADEAFVARARSVTHHVPAVAEPSERLARRALADADRLTAAARERAAENHAALSSFVAERDDLSGRVEPGCPYAVLAHESADGTAVADAAWDAGVLVVPGRFFDEPDRFRIAACRDPGTVRAGLDRLDGALDGLSG